MVYFVEFGIKAAHLSHDGVVHVAHGSADEIFLEEEFFLQHQSRTLVPTQGLLQLAVGFGLFVPDGGL